MRMKTIIEAQPLEFIRRQPPETRKRPRAALHDLEQRSALGVYGLQSSLNFAAGVAQKVGSATVDLGISFVATPTGTPIFTGTAGSTAAYYTDNATETTPIWSFQVNLQSRPTSPNLFSSSANGKFPTPMDAGLFDETNSPVCVWIPVQIPTNASFFSFDFTFVGEPKDDLLSASIASTNVFALEARFMPTNTTLNSGPIDVSQWSGQTVELFFGLIGGTSTNAVISLGAMQFYNVVASSLERFQ